MQELGFQVFIPSAGNQCSFFQINEKKKKIQENIQRMKMLEIQKKVIIYICALKSFEN